MYISSTKVRPWHSGILTSILINCPTPAEVGVAHDYLLRIGRVLAPDQLSTAWRRRILSPVFNFTQHYRAHKDDIQILGSR